MTHKINLNDVAEQIKLITVMHSQFKVAYEGICQLVEQSKVSGIPLGGSVVAPPGAGKSHLIKNIEKKFNQNSDLLDPSSAVITISASSSPSSGSIIDRILQQLGHPPGIRATRLQDLRQSILMQAFRDRGVQLLVIDEFQHLFRGKRDTSASEITDLLKEISDQTGVPIFVFGTDELGDLDSLDRQFASRLPARFQIRPFARGVEWKGFLKAFHAQCNFINISVISDLESQIHKACSGSPRTLKFLIIAAITFAISNGISKIDKSCLSAGFISIFGTSSTIQNPFK